MHDDVLKLELSLQHLNAFFNAPLVFQSNTALPKPSARAILVLLESPEVAGAQQTNLSGWGISA
jgi:hypothetical protein